MRKLLAVALLALALPAAASAHATLVQDRARVSGQRVERSPALVLLHFDQSVDALPNAIRVYDGRAGCSRARRSRARTSGR